VDRSRQASFGRGPMSRGSFGLPRTRARFPTEPRSREGKVCSAQGTSLYTFPKQKQARRIINWLRIPLPRRCRAWFTTIALWVCPGDTAPKTMGCALQSTVQTSAMMVDARFCAVRGARRCAFQTRFRGECFFPAERSCCASSLENGRRTGSLCVVFRLRAPPPNWPLAEVCGRPRSPACFKGTGSTISFRLGTLRDTGSA